MPGDENATKCEKIIKCLKLVYNWSWHCHGRKDTWLKLMFDCDIWDVYHSNAFQFVLTVQKTVGWLSKMKNNGAQR